MLAKLDYEEVRIICRKQLENFEYWARRLIHQLLLDRYGDKYFSYVKKDGNFIIKKSIRESVKQRMEANPGRYTRHVDALLMEDIIYILCNQELYKKLFKKALDIAYPNGIEEVRTFLNRLIIPRNNLSHANPISQRHAEQVICYTNDFIEAIKEYYRRENLYMSYNVPEIIKVVDSFGEECYRENFSKSSCSVIWGFSNRKKYELRPGDSYRIDIEVDPTYSVDEYDIIWKITDVEEKSFKNKKYFELDILSQHVSEVLLIQCEIISKKDWHRYRYYDDQLSIFLRILPPID